MFVVLNHVDDCDMGRNNNSPSIMGFKEAEVSPLATSKLDICLSDLRTWISCLVVIFEMSSSEIEFIQWIVDTRKLWIVPESLGVKEQMQAFERAVSIPRTTPPLALIKS